MGKRSALIGCTGMDCLVLRRLRPAARGGDHHPCASTRGGAVSKTISLETPGSWGTWSDDGAVITYEGGGLRILVNEAHYDFWSVAGETFSDVQVEVDATRVGGPTDNDFGLVCRYQDTENFYIFMISSDGYYGIAKLKDNQHSLIGMDQLQYSSLIATEQPMHRIRADCTGQTLRLFVDGNLLMEAQDGDFSAGDVGVLAGSYATPGVDILFDNFVVKQP